MAVISGVNGAVYWNEELTSTGVINSIYFSSGKTITASTAGGVTSTGTLNFVTEGYKAGMLATLGGSTAAGNIRTFTINTVAAKVLTVNEAVVTTVANKAKITFAEAEPGYQEIGFHNWAINYKVGLHDTTAFDTSSGGRSYLASITDWTASAEKYFLSTGNPVNDWLGDTVKARFFIEYASTPSATDVARYYTGNTIVTGIDIGTPVDALITQNISFQGVGALTPTTRITGWSTT